jgi:hypothetical protein
MASGGKKAAIGVGVGCLLLACCGAPSAYGIYYWLGMQAARGQADVFGSGSGGSGELVELGELSDVSWGQITLAQDPTRIHESNTTSSSVLESRERGTLVDYYGLDTSASFFKVKTTTGVDGFVLMTHAEMGVAQTEKLRVVADVGFIYESDDEDATMLEARRKGDELEWFGYSSVADFYKVKTTTGVDGYMPTVDAMIIE